MNNNKFNVVIDNNKYDAYVLVSKKIISDLENMVKLSSKNIKKLFGILFKYQKTRIQCFTQVDEVYFNNNKFLRRETKYEMFCLCSN